MTYEECIQYINSFLKFGSKPGLERIQKLTKLVGSPQNGLAFVHVAGTNGKGSTCSMLSSILRKSGKKTGLFISPFVVDFGERIQVNGEYLDKKIFCEIIEKIIPIISGMDEQPTEFEIITAVAFEYFKINKCDIVVLETGLGGRLDSTNIIKKPLLTIITSIGLDHVNILGDSLEKIAFEKSGIIKNDCPVVVSPSQDEDALSVIFSAAAQKNSTVIMPNLNSVEIIKTSLSGSEIIFDGLELFVPFVGEHQIKNAVTAITAARQLGISDKIIIEGLKVATFPARFEVVCSNPTIIIDGAHNLDGVLALKQSVKSCISKDVEITGIIGVLADKDVGKMVEVMAPIFKRVITVNINNPRAMSENELKGMVFSKMREVEAIGSPIDAFYKALSICGEKGIILVCGSLYLASELRGEILRYVREKTTK